MTSYQLTTSLEHEWNRRLFFPLYQSQYPEHPLVVYRRKDEQRRCGDFAFWDSKRLAYVNVDTKVEARLRGAGHGNFPFEPVSNAPRDAESGWFHVGWGLSPASKVDRWVCYYVDSGELREVSAARFRERFHDYEARANARRADASVWQSKHAQRNHALVLPIPWAWMFEDGTARQLAIPEGLPLPKAEGVSA